MIVLDERRRELLPQLEGLRAEQNDANARIRSATDAAEREREIEAMREVAAHAKELEQELGEVEQELQAALAPLPNLPDPSAAPGPEDELVREVGAVPEARLSTARSPRARGRADRHGSRGQALGGALRLPERRARDARAGARALGAREAAGAGFEPVVPPVLVRERALYGTGFLPDTEQQIYSLPQDELFLVGTSEVALASLHDGEIIDARALAAALCGLLAMLPARGGGGGQGHAGHLPRASVRQGRDVQLRRARGIRHRSTSGSSRSRRRSSASSGCPTACSTSRSAISATRRRRSTTARRGSRARVATAS